MPCLFMSSYLARIQEAMHPQSKKLHALLSTLYCEFLRRPCDLSHACLPRSVMLGLFFAGHSFAADVDVEKDQRDAQQALAAPSRRRQDPVTHDPIVLATWANKADGEEDDANHLEEEDYMWQTLEV